MGKFGMAQMNGQQTVVTLDQALDYWFGKLVEDVKQYITSKIQRYGLQYATNPLVHTSSDYHGHGKDYTIWYRFSGNSKLYYFTIVRMSVALRQYSQSCWGESDHSWISRTYNGRMDYAKAKWYDLPLQEYIEYLKQTYAAAYRQNKAQPELYVEITLGPVTTHELGLDPSWKKNTPHRSLLKDNKVYNYDLLSVGNTDYFTLLKQTEQGCIQELIRANVDPFPLL